MDAIASTAAAVTGQSNDHPVLAAFPDLTKRLRGTPRFLFDDPSIATAVELTLGRPKVLREAMQHLVIPYDQMWIEWAESGRAKLRQRFQNQNELPLPQRVGFLMETDPGGRSGQITWLWTSTAKEQLTLGKLDVPCLAPIAAYFDLDRDDIAQPSWLTEGLIRANIGSYWHDKPVQLDALESIWRTAEHKASPWGAEYLNDIYRAYRAGYGAGHAYGAANRRNMGGRSDFSEFIGVQYADVYGEYIMVWAVLIMLTASRPIIDREHVSLHKLNKARHKRHEPPLFDHTKVTLHLKQHPGPVVERGPLGYLRKSPRIYLVSSYLARRGDKHWVIQPYWRGQGEVIHRRVRVTP